MESKDETNLDLIILNGGIEKMDTVSVTVRFDNAISIEEVNFLESYNFIKYIGVGRANYNCARFKISYPKFVGRNNATLVHNGNIVLSCNLAFVNAIRSIRPNDNITIKINRIDIPYTIYMNEGETFDSYKGVFYTMASVYDIKHPNASAIRSINNFLTDTIETVILADTTNVSDYNNKVTIYNQYKRFMDTHQADLNRTLVEHPDLPNRIRIEVSKKINRLPVSLEEFAEMDLYGQYNNDFLDYAINNMFDQACLNTYNDRLINKWVNIFNNMGNKSYRTLGWMCLEVGDNYEAIREGLRLTRPNQNTLENAVTRMRATIGEVESTRGYKIMDVGDQVGRILFNLNRYKIL